MTSRIKSLDSFRMIAAFLVVFIHYVPDGVSDLMKAFCRIAVPFFFMVSGYFVYSDDTAKICARCKKNVIKLTKLCLIMLPLLVLYACAVRNFKGVVVRNIIHSLLSWKFILFNFNFCSRFWFLRALIYVYLVLWGIMLLTKEKHKEKCDRVLLILTGVVIVSGIIFCKYSALFGINIYRRYYEIPCKFIESAFGSFLMGYFVKKYQSTLAEKFNLRNVNLLLIFGIGLQLIEFFGLNFMNADKPATDYFSTFIMLFAIFQLLLICYDWNPFNISAIGNEYSLWVYILHMIVLRYINWLPWKYIRRYSSVQTMMWLKVLTGCIVSVCLAFIGKSVVKKVKELRLRKTLNV